MDGGGRGRGYFSWRGLVSLWNNNYIFWIEKLIASFEQSLLLHAERTRLNGLTIGCLPQLNFPHILVYRQFLVLVSLQQWIMFTKNWTFAMAPKMQIKDWREKNGECDNFILAVESFFSWLNHHRRKKKFCIFLWLVSFSMTYFGKLYPRLLIRF